MGAREEKIKKEEIKRSKEVTLPAFGKVVAALKPLPDVDRRRVVEAALILLKAK